MPFVPHIVDDSPTAGISGLSVALKKGKRDRATRMIVFLTERVSTELAWPVGTLLEVQIGTDSDHGLIRLRNNVNATDGAKVVAAGKGKFARIEVSLGHVPGFVDRDERRVPCWYERVEHDFVEIVLPPWAEETHPTKPKVAVPVIEPRPIVAVKRPVLGRRMTAIPNFGDPPRERSALVAGAAKRMQEQEALKLAEAEGRRASEAASRAGELPIDGKGGKKVSTAMAKVLNRLLDGAVHDLDDLYKAMGSSAATTQIVRTTVSLNKAVLRARGIILTSISGVGYQLADGSVEAAKAAVREAGLLEMAG